MQGEDPTGLLLRQGALGPQLTGTKVRELAFRTLRKQREPGNDVATRRRLSLIMLALVQGLDPDRWEDMCLNVLHWLLRWDPLIVSPHTLGVIAYGPVHMALDDSQQRLRVCRVLAALESDAAKCQKGRTGVVVSSEAQWYTVRMSALAMAVNQYNLANGRDPCRHIPVAALVALVDATCTILMARRELPGRQLQRVVLAIHVQNVAHLIVPRDGPLSCDPPTPLFAELSLLARYVMAGTMETGEFWLRPHVQRLAVPLYTVINNRATAVRRVVMAAMGPNGGSPYLRRFPVDVFMDNIGVHDTSAGVRYLGGLMMCRSEPNNRDLSGEFMHAERELSRRATTDHVYEALTMEHRISFSYTRPAEHVAAAAAEPNPRQQPVLRDPRRAVVMPCRRPVCSDAPPALSPGTESEGSVTELESRDEEPESESSVTELESRDDSDGPWPQPTHPPSSPAPMGLVASQPDPDSYDSADDVAVSPVCEPSKPVWSTPAPGPPKRAQRPPGCASDATDGADEHGQQSSPKRARTNAASGDAQPRAPVPEPRSTYGWLAHSFADHSKGLVRIVDPDSAAVARAPLFQRLLPSCAHPTRVLNEAYAAFHSCMFGGARMPRRLPPDRAKQRDDLLVRGMAALVWASVMLASVFEPAMAARVWARCSLIVNGFGQPYVLVPLAGPAAPDGVEQALLRPLSQQAHVPEESPLWQMVDRADEEVGAGSTKALTLCLSYALMDGDHDKGAMWILLFRVALRAAADEVLVHAPVVRDIAPSKAPRDFVAKHVADLR